MTTSATPTVSVRPVAYAVSALPEDHREASNFALRVEWRGGDRWAVLNGRSCLNRDGEWEYEPAHTANRDDEFLARCWLDLDTALSLARDAAPKITRNGYTVADVLPWGAW